VRLGIDFDGTVVDSTATMVVYAREHFALDLRPEETMPPARERAMSPDQYDQMVRDVLSSPLSLDMQPMPGAEKVLSRLTEQHEVHIVTGRYEHEVPFALEWLRARDLQVHGLSHTSRGPKLEPARDLAIDLFFDDLPGELTNLEALSLRPVLLVTPYNEAEPRAEGWHVVPDGQRSSACASSGARAEAVQSRGDDLASERVVGSMGRRDS
jgi:uncharacterized HAD superfamily protein